MTTHKSCGSSLNIRLSHFMLKHIVQMLDLYPTLNRQIEHNHKKRFEPQDEDGNIVLDKVEDRILSNSAGEAHGNHRVPLTRELASVKKWHKIHYAIYTSIYLFELARCLIIHLMSLEALSDYYYLDCYILGRARFIGRINKISSSVLLTILTVFIAYQYAIAVLKPNLEFQALEFMLYKYEHVRANERRFESSKQVKKNVARYVKPRNWLREPVNELESDAKSGQIQPSPVFYLRNHFYGDSIHCKWILRPNRTTESWIVLTDFARYALYATGVLIVSTILLASYTLAGSILTDLGFELGYPSCVTYIQSKHRRFDTTIATASAADNITAIGNDTKVDYSHNYRAPHQMKIEDIPAIIPVDQVDLQSTYNLIRIVVDVITNIFWYVRFAAVCSGIYFLVLMCTIDIMVNAREIEKRLTKHIKRLAEFRLNHEQSLGWRSGQRLDQQTAPARLSNVCYLEGSQFYGNNLSPNAFLHRTRPSLIHYQIMANRQATMATLSNIDDLHEESAILQEILVDHLLLARQYSKVVSFFFNLIFLFYFQYTLLIIYWISTIQSRSVEFEFLFTQALGFVIMVMYFSSAALARSLNIKLYELVTQAMALDTNLDSKKRWASVMYYYSPKSLYCFLLFDSIEISWLLCLKFVSWMSSAFVVLASFFYMTRS